jgi:DNA invertase Pin-like site-specific DNA recombinase
MIYFYARVSTKGQNTDRQLEAAKDYPNVDEIFVDKQSGKNFDRPEYERLKATVVKGDEVIVKELDRLGRNKDGIKKELEWFKNHGVLVRILDIPTTLMVFPEGQSWVLEMVNNVLIEVMGSIAEQEREKILKRQEEGIAAMPVVNGKKFSAKKGCAYGRKAIALGEDFEKFLKKQKDGLMTVEECCKILGIGRSTWYARAREVSV